MGGICAAATFRVLSLSLPVPDLDPWVEMFFLTCARERRLSRRKKIAEEEEL